MSRKLLCLLAALLLVGIAFAPTAAHAQTTVGYVSIDTPSSGEVAFDIYGLTGSEVGGNPDGDPITTAVTLLDLSLTVGGVATSPVETFTLQGDGVSYTGLSLPDSDIAGEDTATLSGTFDETFLTLSLGPSDTETIEADFTAVITGDGPLGVLQDGDSALIVATIAPPAGGGGGPVTPEPAPFLMVGTGLTALAGMRRRFLMTSICKFVSGGF
jgi:hypothetical protein